MVSSVVFKDITVNSRLFLPSSFSGLDEEHTVQGVTIDALTVNGQRCSNAQEAHLKMNAYVSGVVFDPANLH